MMSRLLCGALLCILGAGPVMAQSINLHRVFPPGGCELGQEQVETVDLPRGRVSISLHIKNYNPMNRAGYPLWIGFQRWEPDKNGWSGWVATISEAGESTRARQISSARKPDVVPTGGELLYEEVTEIFTPFRIQAQIRPPRISGALGSCSQAGMETFLTLTLAPDTSTYTWTGEWSGGLSLTQNGAQVTGVEGGEKVVGTINAAQFDGYWLDTSSRYKCNSERGGTFYWGRIRWVMSPNGKELVGGSSYCDADPSSGTNWNATRVGDASQPPASTGADNISADTPVSGPASGSDKTGQGVVQPSSTIEDPVSNVTWNVCAYPNASEGCGQWRFTSAGEVQGLVAGKAVWTGRWTRLDHYVYRFEFTYAGVTDFGWVRFADTSGTGRANDLTGFHSSDMTTPNRKGIIAH